MLIILKKRLHCKVHLSTNSEAETFQYAHDSRLLLSMLTEPSPQVHSSLLAHATSSVTLLCSTCILLRLKLTSPLLGHSNILSICYSSFSTTVAFSFTTDLEAGMRDSRRALERHRWSKLQSSCSMDSSKLAVYCMTVSNDAQLDQNIRIWSLIRITETLDGWNSASPLVQLPCLKQDCHHSSISSALT